MAATFGLTRAGTPEEVIDACDLVMVMDENLQSRTALVRRALEAGKHVFADKVLSDRLAVTRELTDLAASRNVMVAAWSQQGFCPEYDAVAGMPPGGVALVGFPMTVDILKMYGIHLISSVQGCFPGTFSNCRLFADERRRVLCMETDDGTRIVAAAGEDFPAGVSRVDYCVDGKAVLIEATDRAGAFRRAAADLVGMLDGRPARFTPRDMLEASRLLELMTAGTQP
jgi:hypothetical protein